MNTKKMGAMPLVLAVVAMLVAVFAVTAFPTCDLLNATALTGENTLRVHGEDSFGPGDPSVADPRTGNAVEDLPYTESIAPFDPQHIQAPPKDSITFNPLLLSHYIDSNNGEFDNGFLQMIKTDAGDATEKVFWRQWYEPMHLDKDVDCNGALECLIRDGGDGKCDTTARGDDNPLHAVDDANIPPGAVLIDPGDDGVLDSVPGDIDGDGVVDRKCCMDDRVECDPDEAYPAVMQEFTYMLLEGKSWASKPEPTHGLPGETQFVFPVGIEELDIDSDCGYGLTSLDADFDGTPDIVMVDSELSLWGKTGIAADFNGNDALDPLDTDGQPLTGDELVVLTLESKILEIGDRLQFMDHMIEVDAVQTSDDVRLNIYYMGDPVLDDTGTRTVHLGEMLMVMNGENQIIDDTTLLSDDVDAMPWFVWVQDVDWSTNPNPRTATVVVGRALGHPHTAMEASPGVPDDRDDGDPWFIKRFYVDGHEYNVVAVETFGDGDPIDNDEDVDYDDGAEFKYITIRTPIPKEGEYMNGGMVPFYLIEQHSVRLEVYDEHEYLSVMPPFNHEHVMVEDVQDTWSMDPVLFLGPLQFNTEAITQTDVGDHIWYIEELRNPQFTGELLEKYNEGGINGGHDEWWYAEQYNTKPDLYTEFMLPGGHGLYLLTSAFVAPSAQGQIVMQDEEYELIINGNRVKFWFDPADGTKIYKDTDGLRVFGEYNRGPGDASVGVDVLPYTDPVAVFNPQQPQSPRKDSITFDPAYMAEFIHTGEPLSDMYGSIKTEGEDAYEKTYFRLWYEPDHWDKDANNDGERTTDECYPAVMREFTYIYLDAPTNLPSHAAPGRSTKFAFPIATDWTDLQNSTGYGLNTFDCNFDLEEDVVMVHSEETLEDITGIGADFNGDGVVGGSDLDPNDITFDGDEYVIFAVENVYLEPGDHVMFLDHMVELVSVSSQSKANLNCYSTGGGTGAFIPESMGSVLLDIEDMAILEETTGSKKILSPGDDNLGLYDGAWFVYVISANNGLFGDNDSVTLMIGRALGEARHHVGDDGAGTPWYLKRFYVDGHEYNVVAVKTVPEDVDEFKFITIRTPSPKVPYLIEQHSQDLEVYPICSNITVLPPFNYQHTVRQDVLPGWTPPYHAILPDLEEMGYMGVKDGRPPLVINITAETNETRFFGELKEMYNRRPEVVVDATVTASGTTDAGNVEVSGEFTGTVDGRSMDGEFNFTITPKDACCDGVITGLWNARDEEVDDEPPLYNDNNISDFDGVITGNYTYADGSIDMTWHRGELTPSDDCLGICETDDECKMQHDYLCFWIDFDIGGADITCVDCAYTAVIDFPVDISGVYSDDLEEWMTEQFWTRPDQYTEFELPDDQYYLLTSSWYAPQAVWRTVNENNDGAVNWYTGNRVKFWYNPATALDLFVNQDTEDNRYKATLVDQWDENGNGHMDLDEMVTAILAYLSSSGTTPTMDQLIELLVDYLMYN